MYISYNKYQLWGKVVMLLLTFSILSFIIRIFIIRHVVITFSIGAAFVFALWILLFLMVFLAAMQLLFLPKGVEINNEEKALTIHYVLMKSNVLYSNDIKEYTSTKIFTKSSTYEGVLIHSKNGRKYLFDDFNIKDYKPIKSFLDDSQVNFVGNEKYNNVSYFIAFFKHQ